MIQEIEKELILKIQKGNYHLFTRIIQEYQNPLFGFLFRIVKNTDDAKDLCQDTFFKAYRSIRSFKGRSKFSTWLFQIGYRKAVNFLKRRKKYSEIIHAFPISTGKENAARDLERRETGKIIENIMTTIHHDYRTALHLFYREERSYQEIAAIMKIPINSVKSHIFRGKKEIRNRILQDSKLEATLS
jgi:RNA polymerase sigma-70 factor (ECF subfamily)